MKLPRVSICIPTYCQIDYLREALRSVKEQDFDDYELIISDDTPDDTVQKLVASIGFDDRLHYYRNLVSLGSPENWNSAVRLAKGEYIKLLHHDDRFSHSGALSAFVRLLDAHSDADFAFSASSAVNILHGHSHNHIPSLGQVDQLIEAPEKLFFKNIIGAPSATIYRNGLDFEYDTNLQWLVDVDFYIQLLSKNSNVVYTPEVLIAAATNATHQITELCKSNAPIDLFEHMYLYEKIAPKISGDPGVQPVWFRLFERYQIYSQEDLKQYGIRFQSFEALLKPFFEAYHQAWLKRTPYRFYARLPESFKNVIRLIYYQVKKS